MRSGEKEHFGFAGLLQYVQTFEKARRSNQVKFFAELMPLLEESKRVERHLDRESARRFNVFKYVRTDELGLSQIIAELLDPSAEHGQGHTLLVKMLEAMPETRHLAGKIAATDANPFRVTTERPTSDGRRIDVSVEIPTESGRFCLAFENKPYAGDQRCQIPSYLSFLNQQGYEDGFLLVWVPPTPREPSEWGFPKKKRAKWEGRFRVVPYIGGDYSLEDWFQSCCRAIDAQRLKWFLRQAQEFCRQQFGVSNLNTDAETLEIRQYLLENPDLLQAAYAVHEAWPMILDETCEGFLRHLREKVEARLRNEHSDYADRLNVRYEYGGSKPGSNFLFVGIKDRPPYEIGIQAQDKGPNNWIWGVRAPRPYPEMSASEQEICDRFGQDLKADGLGLGIVKDPPWAWPQYEYLPRYRNWTPLVRNLHEETNKDGGPVTEFITVKLLDVAAIAISAIDRIDSAHQAESER